jgi:hypothetical protein
MANALHFTDGAKFRIELVTQAIVFYEKSVQIPGIEGRDPINITTNDNGDTLSFAPPVRGQVTPAQAVVTYDSTDLTAILAARNVKDTILVKYPDDTTEDPQVGWLRSAIPDNAEDAAQPTMTVTFEFEGEAPA